MNGQQMSVAHTRVAALSAILLLFVAPHPVLAQNVGDRVRLVMAGETLTGDVTETSETGFTMTLASGLLSGYEAQRDVEYRQIEKLEVRTCCMDYARVLAVAGGVLLGGVLGELSNQQTCTDSVLIIPFPVVSETCTREGNNEIWGGLAGGAAGFIAGLALLEEKWEIIPPGDLGGRSLAPLVGMRSDHAGATITLGARLRF